MWNGHILTLERRRNLKKYAPELIDDFKKYSNFQSFSYIRVCFSRIDFAQKLWDFDKIQIYISMKKSMVNLDVYNMSQQAPTIKSYKQLKWRYQMKGRCKICLPCIIFLKRAKCTYMYVNSRGDFFHRTSDFKSQLRIITASDGEVQMRNGAHTRIHQPLLC